MSLVHALSALTLGTLLGAAQAPPQPATPAPPPEYVTEKGFANKIFPVQHRAPQYLANALRALGSGFKGARITHSDQNGIYSITVRDFPENIAAIQEALLRLDVPAAARREVELHIHVLFASRQEGANEGCPEELKDVLAALKGTLSYRNYALATSFLQRTTDGGANAWGNGETEMALGRGPKGEARTTPVAFRWGFGGLNVEKGDTGALSVLLKSFTLTASERRGETWAELASLRSDLILKDGDKVVVGTSAIKDRGLIVVVIAKVLPQ